MSATDQFVRVVRRNDGIALIEIDVPGEAVNTLRSQSAAEFQEAFDEIDRASDVRGVILCSKKTDNFIAGADISMLDAVVEKADGTRLSRVGQAATHRISECKVPVVAAIHGACLGGGLEIALACHARVASMHDKTKLGLPEVQLGILPGMGGTVRLIDVVGLSTGLDMLLTGRQLSSRRALAVGLVDHVVEPAALIASATESVESLISAREKGESTWSAFLGALDPAVVRERALADNPLGRKVVFDQARKEVRKKTRGNYPAPERILQVVRLGLEKGAAAGFEAEADAFGDLVVTPEARALRHVYFAQQALKKYSGPAPTDQEATEVVEHEVRRLGIIGGGLMGQGIASVSLHTAHLSVRVRDTSRENLTRAVSNIDSYLSEQVERRRMTKWQRQEHLNRLTLTTDGTGLENCDIVIEAVFEDLTLKQQILAEFEQRQVAPQIFASNTSALPISSIAGNARRKDRVIGMHYFSPVQKMPLLEIVVTAQTAPWVIRQAVALGKRQGKTVIVVNDGPGFYTTRILAPYLNEAAHLLIEGHSVDAVDKQLLDAGFPVGPFTLLDEIGIDVGDKVGRALHEAFGERLAPPADLHQLVEAGRLGKKEKRGFYSYATEQRGKRPVDTSVYEDLGLEIPAPPSSTVGAGLAEPSSAAERCLLMMVNEAAHCMTDGVLNSTDDGDIGAIFGLGFPPYLGGPFHFIKTRGASEIIARLKRLEHTFGPRFAPAPYLHTLKA